MRFSRAFLPTLKEVPSDAEVTSHVLMVRGGYIRRLAAGIYNFLPLGLRVIHKIETIVREEMDRTNAQQVLMPATIPAELWHESGRWNEYGPELLRFKDRKKNDFCFGPTHEEVIVDMVRRDTNSYRDLPQLLYQVQSKFRDEKRPRAGLMRGREFIMKDAYSFDVSEQEAAQAYAAMYEAYGRIFKRCGLDFRSVEADTGAIGGQRSEEFQVLAESGEDSIIACDSCDYAANVEQAELREPTPGDAENAALEKVSTPGKKTIEDVAAFLDVAPAKLIKTMIYMADGAPVAGLVRGDRGLNEVALKKLLGATELNMAREGQIQEATGGPSGFSGPSGLALRVVADFELRGASAMVVGANELDQHLVGFDVARDAQIEQYVALRLAEAGDRCARCETGTYRQFRGIEVGHVFLLGTKYSEPMGCTFLDEDGESKAMVMGCYGIGITRIAAAAIEQNHDERGIVWPISLAPYEVTVLPLQMGDDDVVAAGEKLYRELQDLGIEVLLDDRSERPGSKFNDADLIGIPLRIAIGKRSLKDGNVEVKWRRESDAQLLPLADAAKAVAELVSTKKASLRT